MRFTGRTTISALIRRLAKAEEEITNSTPEISQPQINEAVTDYMASNPINVTWNSVSNKPLTFTPTSHGHDYAPTIHTHNEYAETGHTHIEYEPADGAIQLHINTEHAPINAQKNSDITKGEIESKLTGDVTTHIHSAYSPLGMAINVQALTSSPTDGQTVYFGTLPKAPTTTANISKVYIRRNCTLKIAEIYVYSGTAGTGENWSLYVRKNNSQDTLIATLGVATNERIFSNTNMNVLFAAGDYFEIKGVQPTWATNPATTIYGGYLYFE